MKSERDGLAARVGELEKDAERYRWLRDNGADHTMPKGSATESDTHGPLAAWVQGRAVKCLEGPFLDAAIDAARKP